MKRKGFAPEKIIRMLREAEVSLSQGWTVGRVCRQLGISEQTDYRWRKPYGGMKISRARRMKERERENGRLKKAVAELTLDNWQHSEVSKCPIIDFSLWIYRFDKNPDRKRIGNTFDPK